MKFNIKAALKTAASYVSEHRQAFLIGAGVTGFTSAVVLTVPATLKAKKAVDEKTEEKGEPLTKWEVVKTSAKYYILPGSLTIASGVAVGVGAKQYSDTIVGLATGLGVAEKRIEKLEKAIPEVFGEDAKSQVERQINKDEVEKMDIGDQPERENIERYPFRDPLTGAEREMTPYEAKNGIANFHFYVSREGSAPLADLLDYLGFDVCSLDEEARHIAFNMVYYIDGPNDHPGIGYEVIERSDGKFGAVLTYDRNLVNEASGVRR